MGEKVSKKNTPDNRNKSGKERKRNKKWYEKSGWVVFWLIVFFPLGLFLMWKYSNWNKIIKIIVSLFIVFSIVSESSNQNLENISLSADTGYNYNIYSEVPIEIKTDPSNCSIPKNAFTVSGGELKISEKSAIFMAQQPGAYEVFAEYEGVKSNTLVINYEDKEAIAQAEAKAKAEEEARIKAEAEAKIKAEKEAKAKAEEESKARAKAEEESKARAKAEEARAKAEQENKEEKAKNISENIYNGAEEEYVSKTDTSRKEQMVWLSETGEKYHNKPNCGRMNPNRARQVTLSEAQNAGYDACSKCF